MVYLTGVNAWVIYIYAYITFTYDVHDVLGQ
jgi:hypothetical protein